MEARILSGQAAVETVSESLRVAPQLRRDQLHVPAPAFNFHAGRLGGGNAPGFVFAVKANQRITHMARLKNAGDATELFFRMIDPLRTARRLGPVLFQLPPNLKCDVPLLRDYLALLPAGIRYAFEFRGESWLCDPVYEELRARNISLCVAESERLEVPEVITADFVYFRLRKPDYTEADIDAFAARARDLLAGGRDLYLMFKHEETPDGALNAEMVLRKTAAG